MKKRFLVGILTGLMLISSLSVSASADFSDVNTGDWYYETVTAMTEKGLFEGKGNNLFCPNDTMTRAEFITVCARILYGDNIPDVNSSEWWMPYYDILINNTIITKTEFEKADINTTITREEMALLAIRVMSARGEEITIDMTKLSIPGGKHSFYQAELQIPDRLDIGDYYKIYVLKAYEGGIIQGASESGSFLPKNGLTRAEAATVLLRIIDPSFREKGNAEDRPITIYEGQERNNRIAKEGDIFIKKDGTQIVLKKGPHGILGEGQCVAPDVGLTSPMYHSKIEKSGDYMPQNMGEVSTGGNSIQEYFINPLTGEGHWASEWTVLSYYTDPLLQGIKGTETYEISDDKNYIWMDVMWQTLACHPEYYSRVLGQ